MSPEIFAAVYNTFSLNPITSRSPSASHRLDSLSVPQVASGRPSLGAISNEPHRHQISVDPPGALRPFRRRIGPGSVGRTCRTPCPASSCHAWHSALFLDVCRRDGSRYCGRHVSGRTQSDCPPLTPQFCAASDRGLPDFSKPRPSFFLSVILVAHTARSRAAFVSHMIHWVGCRMTEGNDSSREKGPASLW